jgi:cell filamentation protein
MYEAGQDPHCYAGTDILTNIPGLRDAAALERFEMAIVAQRASEPLPAGRLSARHYRAIHYHLFRDVNAWPVLQDGSSDEGAQHVLLS